MPLVLLTMRSGIERVQVAEHGLAHQVGVQRRDAVDACEPTKARWPMRTRRPCSSSISDTDDEQRGRQRGCPPRSALEMAAR